jgi:hypothetical protein
MNDLHPTFYFILDMECLSLVQVVTTVYMDASDDIGVVWLYTWERKRKDNAFPTVMERERLLSVFVWFRPG